MKLRRILGIPKSIFFNMYYFPLKTAIKLPVHVAPDVKLAGMGSRNSVRIVDPSKHISLGFGESFALGGKTYWNLTNNARVVFNGSAQFGKGTQIISGGGIEFGDRFYCNADCIINAGKGIHFGDDVLIGWRCTIIDGDGHKISSGANCINSHEEINIGNHVWLASDVTVLKGAKLPNGCVVGSKGCITKKFEEERLLIGGFNRILQHDVSWER